MNCCVFPMGHCNTLHTKSFRRCQIIHGRPLLKKNQMWLNHFTVLHKGWLKRHCIIKNNYFMPRFLLLTSSFGKELPHDISNIPPPLLREWIAKEPMLHQFHRLLVAVRQLLSIFAKIFLHHSITATTLCMTNHRKATSFCALALCQMMFYLGYDWLLNLSWDHFGLHQVKHVRVTMEFEVLKRQIIRPTLSIDMVQRVLRWERQKRCSGRKEQGPITKK
jgi:hypothetical protein